jgi:serine/threonine-protein kinase
MTDVLARLTSALADRYLIERELGQGGMATVYLAHDVRHDRKVALKVLRAELSAILGADRFLHEIKTTANLQHPHILPLHDSGEAEGIVYYVMPYVEGESLRDRLTREKQLPVNDAVRIAREVLSALDYAHRHGVVHRDIKPENILLHEGQALVADFGIALAVSAAGAGTRMTETGMSLGTPHYMSPEQAMGEREITPKSDVYALGCVLYEMLVGEPPFTGPTAQAIVARVMTEQPRSLTLQRHTVPAHVEAAVRMALEKLPADRFASAAQFSEALSMPGVLPAAAPALEAKRGATGASATEAASAGTAARTAGPSRRRVVLASVPWVLLFGVAGLAAWDRLRPRPAPPAPPVVRFTLQLPANAGLGTANGSTIAMSPDGSRIVYVGASPNGNQLFLRGLDQLDPVPLPGTQNAISPFFSPDGQWVAYYAGGKLQKLPLTGGPALTVANVRFTFGGSWGSGDTIVFQADSGLMAVPAAGGDPRVLLRPDTSRHEVYLFPEYLPDGHALLFYIRGPNGNRLAALDLRTGAVKRFEQAGLNPHYVASGHVVLATQTGTLIAVPFDPVRLDVTGSPVPVAENVVVGGSGAAKMGMSLSGAFAYQVGQAGIAELVLVDRSGAVRPLPAERQDYFAPRLSPDGRRIAVQVAEPSSPNTDVWIYDITQRTRTRLTFDQSGQRPTWTPDGRRVVYSRGPSGNADLAWIPADGSGPAESLLVAPDDQWSGAISPDGRTMVFRAGAGGPTKRSIHLLPLVGTRTPRPFLENPFDNHSPTLSPDGRWVAYISDESGRLEVYVRPFPGPGGRWQVSLDGGVEPRWSPTGREIFYRNGNAVLAAAVQTQPTFNVGERRELFQGTFAGSGIYPGYDVTRDGRMFVMVRSAGQTQGFVVVLNWFDQLRRGTPAPARAAPPRP